MQYFAQKLKEILEFTDSAVFPQNPLSVVLVNDPPNPRYPQFSLAIRNEMPPYYFYQIHVNGLKEYFDQSKDFNIHIMLESDDPLYGKVPYAYMSEEEALMGVAIHEVRHRLQYQVGVRLLTPLHTQQINRCRWWGEIQAKHYESVPNGHIEFDAKFFECYGAYEVRRGRLTAPEQIHQLLTMTPEQFIARK